MCAIQDCKAIPCDPHSGEARGSLAVGGFVQLGIGLLWDHVQIIGAVVDVVGMGAHQNRVLDVVVRDAGKWIGKWLVNLKFMFFLILSHEEIIHISLFA